MTATTIEAAASAAAAVHAQTPNRIARMRCAAELNHVRRGQYFAQSVSEGRCGQMNFQIFDAIIGKTVREIGFQPSRERQPDILVGIRCTELNAPGNRFVEPVVVWILWNRSSHLLPESCTTRRIWPSRLPSFSLLDVGGHQPPLFTLSDPNIAASVAC